MTAIVFCGDEDVLSFSANEHPVPRIGECIIVEQDTRRLFRVLDVIYCHRTIPVYENRTPLLDTRIEIHVRQE